MDAADAIEVDVCIVGAGVVGLAIADAVSRRLPEASVFVFERHPKFGQEASSHNSEVIHAGIYYKPGSYKAQSCVRGRDLLYRFCDENDVPYLRCGKFIVASDAGQAVKLEEIAANAMKNGVELERLSGAEASKRLGLDVALALWSPLSGIVDSHSLMQRLLDRTSNHGVHFLFNHRFNEVRETGESTSFTVIDPSGEVLPVRTRCFINAAGLGAARVAQQFPLSAKWEIKACRGRYFFLSSEWTGRYKSLIYPLPDPRGGLGTHLTIDLSLRGRLGPDVDWPSGSLEADDWDHYKFDTNVDELRTQFFEAGRKFLPDLKSEDLSPDYVGVRAKLFKNGEAHQEFVLDTSYHGSIHCLGIESPGVTSSLAIADDVAERAAVILAGRPVLEQSFA